MNKRQLDDKQLRFIAVVMATAAIVAVALLCRGPMFDWLLRYWHLSGPWLSGFNLIAFFVCLALCLTPFGQRKIGGAGATPRLPTVFWIFAVYAIVANSAIVTWSGAEPVFHFVDTPLYRHGFPGTAQATATALSLTLVHWGPLSVATIACFSFVLSRCGRNRQASAKQLEQRIIHRDNRRHRGYLALTSILISVCVVASLTALAQNFWSLMLLVDDTAVPEHLNKATLFIVFVIAGVVAGVIVRWPHVGFSIFGMAAAVTTTALLSLVDTSDADATIAAESFLRLAGNFIDDIYRAIDLSVSADIETGVAEWQQAWSAHYARLWIIAAPVYAVALIGLSHGRRYVCVVATLLLTTTISAATWTCIAGKRSLALAASQPDYITEVMIDTTYATRQLLASVSGGPWLSSLPAAVLSIQLLASLAVIAYALNSFAGDWHKSRATGIAISCTVVTLTGLLVGLSQQLNQRSEALVTLAVPVLIGLLLLLTVREGLVIRLLRNAQDQPQRSYK